jgi:hypothetical protein
MLVSMGIEASYIEMVMANLSCGQVGRGDDVRESPKQINSCNMKL